MKTGTSFSTIKVLFAALALIAAIPACGSDDDDDTGSTGSNSKCAQVCDLQESGMCSLFSAADCKQLCPAYPQISAGCGSAESAWSNCVVENDSACPADGEADPCQAELDALETACSMAGS